MPTLLALDLARNTGWAHWVPGRKPKYGTQEFLQGLDQGRLQNAFHDWLSEKIRHSTITHIFYEAPIVPIGKNASADKVTILHGMCWHVEFLSRFGRGGWNLETNRVAVQTWRKHFLGRGTGKRQELKDLCIETCRQRGLRPGTDDAADALGILDWGAHQLGLQTDWAATPLEAAARG